MNEDFKILLEKNCYFDKECHPVITLRQYETVRHHVIQCGRCGNYCGRFLGKKQIEGFNTVPFNEELYSKFINAQEQRFTIPEEKKELHKNLKSISEEIKLNFYKQNFGIESKEFKDVYEPYLKSKEWKMKRQNILERDNYICRYCKTAKAEEVHHLSYDNIGNESDFELMSVCSKCHKLIHDQTCYEDHPENVTKYFD